MDLIVYLSYNVACGIYNDAVSIWEITFDLKVATLAAAAAASGRSFSGDPYGIVPH